MWQPSQAFSSPSPVPSSWSQTPSLGASFSAGALEAGRLAAGAEEAVEPEAAGAAAGAAKKQAQQITAAARKTPATRAAFTGALSCFLRSSARAMAETTAASTIASRITQ